MVITDEEEKKIKDHLFTQLDKLPPESRLKAKEQIQSMSKDQLQELIRQNDAQQNSPSKDNDTPDCIFCKIVNSNIPSIKLDENSESIAILDINPISLGHTLIIPKEHNKEPSEQSQELAFSIGKKILETLNPKDITTRASKIQDHTILNVIPIYEDTDFEKRIKTTQDELITTAEKIVGKKILSDSIEKKVEKKESDKPKEPICVFCEISTNKKDSFVIEENKENLAILELNPLSVGHTLVIPKEHKETTQIPLSTFKLSKKIARKIKNKLKANDVKINPTSMNNHALIELIPIYDDSDLKTRKTASKEELEKIKKKLIPRKSTLKKTSKKKNKEEFLEGKKRLKFPKPKYPSLPQLPSRIP
jgi:diadenosine tetraphosphate (Ap4A) HIT family hydrolase